MVVALRMAHSTRTYMHARRVCVPRVPAPPCHHLQTQAAVHTPVVWATVVAMSMHTCRRVSGSEPCGDTEDGTDRVSC